MTDYALPAWKIKQRTKWLEALRSRLTENFQKSKNRNSKTDWVYYRSRCIIDTRTVPFSGIHFALSSIFGTIFAKMGRFRSFLLFQSPYFDYFHIPKRTRDFNRFNSFCGSDYCTTSARAGRR
jgi:hypothetical protein